MSEPTPTSSSAEPSRGRRLLISVVLWVYGISITVFLVSIWGRSVASDTGLVSSAASHLVESDFVTSRIEGWFERALGDVGVADGGTSAQIVALPEVRAATAELIGEAVVEMAHADDGPVVVDVAAAYRPAVPAVTVALRTMGMEVTEAQVGAVVDRLEPLVLAPESDRPMVGPGSGPARTLTVATLVGLASLLSSGGLAIYLAEDRRQMIKTLLTRLAVSAFTFAVFFRLSAWVMDPRGGRAGVSGAVAEVLVSKLWVPLLITAIAGASAWAVRQRHGSASRWAGGSPSDVPRS